MLPWKCVMKWRGGNRMLKCSPIRTACCQTLQKNNLQSVKSSGDGKYQHNIVQNSSTGKMCFFSPSIICLHQYGCRNIYSLSNNPIVPLLVLLPDCSTSVIGSSCRCIPVSSLQTSLWIGLGFLKAGASFI